MALQIFRERPARRNDGKRWPVVAWVNTLIDSTTPVVTLLGAALTTNRIGRPAWTDR